MFTLEQLAAAHAKVKTGGGADADSLIGDAGNDTLNGGAGADCLLRRRRDGLRRLLRLGCWGER